MLQRIIKHLGTKVRGIRQRKRATSEDRRLFDQQCEELGDQFDFLWSGYSGRMRGSRPTSYDSNHQNKRHFTWCAYVTRQLAKHRPQTILDVGSWGQFVFGLAASGADVTMVDIRDHPLASMFPFKFQQADVIDLPFENDSFDAVTFWQNLHHVGIGYNQNFDPLKAQTAVVEISRVIKPGGIGLLATRVKNGKTCLIYGGVRVTGVQDLQDMVTTAGLNFEDVHYVSGKSFLEINRSDVRDNVTLDGPGRGDFVLATLRKPLQ